MNENEDGNENLGFIAVEQLSTEQFDDTSDRLAWLGSLAVKVAKSIDGQVGDDLSVLKVEALNARQIFQLDAELKLKKVFGTDEEKANSYRDNAMAHFNVGT